MSDSLQSQTPVSPSSTTSEETTATTLAIPGKTDRPTYDRRRSAHRETLFPSLTVRALAEFFGTYLIVTVLLIAALLSPISSGNSLFGTAIAAMLAYGVGAAIFSRVSGAHFNPAVSLAAALTGKISWIDALVYIVAQVVASFAAAATLLLLVPSLLGISSLAQVTENIWWTSAANGFADHSPSSVTNGLQFDMKFAIVVELIGSLIVIAAVIGSMRSNGAPTKKTVAATALAYGAASFIAGPVTGAGLNPARSTGVDVIANFKGVSGILPQLAVFWLVPLIAGALVGLVIVIVETVTKPSTPKAAAFASDLPAEQRAALDDFTAVVEEDAAPAASSDAAEVSEVTEVTEVSEEASAADSTTDTDTPEEK